MYDEYTDSMGPAPTLAPGEYILWKGKPKKSAYVADKALSMLPIAVIWAVIDFPMLSRELSAGDVGGILFMAVHLLPVWLWIGSAVTSVIQWKNEDYYLTNKRVIIRKGVFSAERQSVFLKDVHNLQVHHGLLDKMFGSGDVYINYEVHRRGRHRSTSGWFLLNLADPQTIYDRIEQAALTAEPGGRNEVY